MRLATQNQFENRSGHLWTKIQGGIMFGVACIASPCCAPLYVPLVLALLAGTPGAIWLSANVGWLYGGLALISAVSFVLAFRWLRRQPAPKQDAKIASKPELISTVPETNNS